MYATKGVKRGLKKKMSRIKNIKKKEQNRKKYDNKWKNKKEKN